jgi:3-phosphoshikimate 1-carboxyvinyltransferase
MSEYPAEISIEPLANRSFRHVVRVPGSKSLTNRALIVAALATGKSTLTGVLDSEDTRVMVDSLRKLGISVNHEPSTATIQIAGCGGRIPAETADLFIANSGTSVRFLASMVSVGKGRFHLDGSPRMRQRPLGALLAALNSLGATARSDFETGCPPITIDADGLDGGAVFIKGDVSSQFLSGILMAAPYARNATTVEVEGTLVSQPYVAMTLAVMEAFDVRPANHGFRRFNIKPGQYRARKYAIEPDASAASYFFAVAAITGGTVTVEGLGSASIQGDMGFVDVLEHMGCNVERSPSSTTVTGGALRALDVDMNAISDTVMTLAAVSLFADGVTRIRSIGHIRHKETDRIAAVANELRKLGATVEESADGLLIIPPAKISPARIATYDDHRMAMSFATVGLAAEGITILEPGCVAKTYPGFWDDLAKLAV